MTSQYKIEKNIAPPRPEGRGGVPCYPWDQMEVGDSFFVPAGDETAHKVVRRVRSAGESRKMYRKSAEKYSYRMVDGGVRVWRTA